MPNETSQPFQPQKHEISPVALKQRLDRDDPVVLLDVREPAEYQIAHLENALLIPINSLPDQIDRLNPDQEIVAYCHHGMRSMQAIYYLYQNGFKNVQSLAGGIDRWAVEIDSTMNRY